MVIYDKMGAMAKKRYADDYEIAVITDEDGHEKKVVVYHGEYFELAPKGVKPSVFKTRCLLLLAALVVLHISGGVVNNKGMYQFYVALPYVLVFFPLFFMGVGIFRLPKEKDKYQRDEIGLSFDRIRTMNILLMLLLVVEVLGEILFLLFFSGGVHSVSEFLYLLLETASIAAIYSLILLQRKILVQPFTRQN